MIGGCSRLSTSTAPSRVLIKSVALPSEHGSWGFLLEPIFLGLLVASSRDGWVFGFSAIAIFLMHQPLKVAIKDRLKNRRPPRTIWAQRFAAGYACIAVLFLMPLVFRADFRFLVPLVIAAPLILVQLYYDARNKSRELLPELAGAAALGSIAPAIALLDGWLMLPAFMLWIVLVARSIPSILYVRSRLKLERSKPTTPMTAWAAHIAAAIVMFLLALVNELPWLAVLGIAILTARAMVGLSNLRKPRRVAVIGIQEMLYGFSYVAIAAAGYVSGI